MEILVCVKRVPTVGGAIRLTADRRAIDVATSGFTISPHEECAVEEAVRLVERFGGAVTVASVGPVAAEEQLRSCLALGASAAVLIETADGAETGPIEVAAALHAVALHLAAPDPAPLHLAALHLAALHPVTPDPAAALSRPFDLVLLGNEASDTGDYQVGIRLAHLLGRPVATGIKALSVAADGGSLTASRTYRGVLETFTLPLPCVVTVKEGINLPRYPSLPGRLRAKRAAITRLPLPAPASTPAGADPAGADPPVAEIRMTSLRVPDAPKQQATVLGDGVDAVPALVGVLAALGVLS